MEGLNINLREKVEKTLEGLNRKLQVVEIQALLRLGEHIVRQENTLGLSV